MIFKSLLTSIKSWFKSTFQKLSFSNRSCTRSPKRILEPSKTLIAFDLDEVVILGRETGYKKWLKNNPDVAHAIDEVKKKYKLFDATPVLDKAAQDHPALRHKLAEFRKVLVTGTPIPGTVNIINTLSKKGYGIIAASNMTSSTYARLVDNKTLPPEFTKDFYFDATNELNKKPDGSYYEKPTVHYYKNLLSYINQKYPGKFTQVVFIDDELVNIKGAAKVNGIIGIHFTSPEQLLKDLRMRGVEI